MAKSPRHQINSDDVITLGDSAAEGRVYVYSYKSIPNLVKIGHTTKPDVKTRIAEQIATSSPSLIKLEIVYKTSNSADLERQLHHYFSWQRTRGEWFKISAE